MLRVTFPNHSFRLKKEAEKEWIFDEFRKIWVRLTPEEWVRQHFLQFLTATMQYPASLIAVEKEMKLFETRKRFDILVYDRVHQPWMMVECKSTDVELSATVLEQVIRYNMAVPVTYLVVTNGHYTRGFERRDGKLGELEVFPVFPGITLPGESKT
jgi:Type I restriction enzyme R protein N terminus (HSDR_N)